MVKLISILFILFTTQLSAGTLLLLVDFSQSIELKDKQFQLNSYQKALTDPYLLPSLQNTYIEVILFSDGSQIIASGSGEKLSTELLEFTLKNVKIYSTTTCLANALIKIHKRLEEFIKPVVIDVSGDGQDNCSHIDDLANVRNQLEESGVIINTLPIVTVENPEMIIWYETNVQTHSGFTIPVTSYDSFYESLFEKLMSEISFITNLEKQIVFIPS